RSRDHRRRGRRPHEPAGAQPVSRETTRPRRLNAADLAPFAILALMVVALALVPVFTQYTVRTANVYDIFQNFASYGLVALALGITIIAGEFDLSVSSMYLLGGMVAVLTGDGSPMVGILVAIGIFAVTIVALRYLRVGRDIRAIGGDRRAARVAGVSVDRLLIGVF